MSDFFSAVMEKAPSIPKLPVVDLTKEQLNAISANAAALPGAESLAGNINQFNLDQWLKSMKFAFPQFEQARDLITGNAMSLARGEIPKDVSENIQRSAAVRALGGGFSGSGMQGALTARDLGTTSLNLMTQGANALERWISNIRTPNPFDVTSMFVSPQQLYTTKNEQNLQQFQRKYIANLNAAHYAPMSRIGRGLDAALDIVASYYGANAGQSQPQQANYSSSFSGGGGGGGGPSSNDGGGNGQGGIFNSAGFGGFGF